MTPSLLRALTGDEAFVWTAAAGMPEPLDLSGGSSENYPGMASFTMEVFIVKLKANAPRVRVSRGLAMFVVAQCQNPAMAAEWAYTIMRLREVSRGSVVDMSDYAREFGMRVPTAEAMSAAWRAQKNPAWTQGTGECQNLVDDGATWAAGPTAPEPEFRARFDPGPTATGGGAAEGRRFDLS